MRCWPRWTPGSLRTADPQVGGREHARAPRYPPLDDDWRPLMADASRALLVWKRRLPGFLMSAPAVIVFLAMFVIPMGLAFVLSLTNWTGYSLNLEFIGFDNYLDAFK